MIRIYRLALVVALAGCGSATPTTNYLCRSCDTNADCAGNPCFHDTTDNTYCGAPYEACPDGFNCQNLTNSDGTMVKTCFPIDGSCANTPINDDLGAGGDGGED